MAKETRTYRDRASYLIQAVSKRRKKIKDLAIQYKGGKCQICGYSKYNGALDFHHTDPTTKKFGLSLSGLTRSWEKTKEELDKCVLVCTNCHREIHAGVVNIEFTTKLLR
jgi:5-methylcytosine-specific restriction endonuclease McrA